MTSDTATPATVPGERVPDGAAPNVGVELQYTHSTTPFPLPVSPDSGPYRPADLAIVLTRRASRPIECGPVTVSVPVGDGATALAAATAGMTASADQPGWNTAIADTGRVTFTPPGGAVQIGKENGLALSLSKVPVNRTVGRALLTVSVRWRSPGETGEDSWNQETVDLPVPKFPPAFSLGELRATPGRIGYGGSVTLTWQAAGGSFRLRYGKADILVTGQDSYTAHNITRDTVFHLSGTSTSASGEVEAVRSVWVTVDVPDVVTTSLTVTRSIVADRLAAPTFTAPAFTATTVTHRPELSMRRFDPRQRRWSEPARLPFGPAASPPALTVHGGKLHLVFRPYASDQLTWAQYDGSTWRTMPQSPGRAAPAPVALASASTGLVCAFQTPDGEQQTVTSSNGTSWGTPSAMPAPSGGAVSFCWDGTALYAAMRIVVSTVPGVAIYRQEAQQWREFHMNPFIPVIGSPELVLQGENHLYYFRSLGGAVWTRWRHKADTGQLNWNTQKVNMKAAHDVRLATAGPALYALFPDSEGALHLRTSGGPSGLSTALVDEYRTLETPALTWYGDQLIAVGRAGACPP
ncbi:hypothetical protein ABT039_25630 [Streptomyces lasiicapitis]|uniref:hypothetical protein n=1 Tax=Streptomyces lasiicapitis TaxID=1923961 RepID=UPI00332C5BB0